MLCERGEHEKERCYIDEPGRHGTLQSAPAGDRPGSPIGRSPQSSTFKSLRASGPTVR